MFSEHGLKSSWFLAMVGIVSASFSSGILCAPLTLVESGQVAIPFRTVAGATQKPVWSGKAWLGVANQRSATPSIYEFDQSGRRSEDYVVKIPGSASILITQIARNSDGALAAVGTASATPSEMYARFLMLVSPDRSRQLVIRAAPFNVQVITFAADGVLWAVGAEVDDKGVLNTAHPMVRRFDSSGKQLSAHTLRTEFPNIPAHVHPATMSHLVASRDRVGWYSPEGRVYIEYSLDGKELLRVPHIPDTNIAGSGANRKAITGIALTDSNDLIVGLSPSNAATKQELLMLDRESRRWTAVSSNAPASRTMWIAGANGDEVVSVTQTAMRLFRPTRE